MNIIPKIRFHIGGFAEYEINDKFTLQPELLFSTQGNLEIQRLLRWRFLL